MKKNLPSQDGNELLKKEGKKGLGELKTGKMKNAAYSHCILHFRDIYSGCFVE